MKKNIYVVMYYYPNQNKFLSDPQCYITEDEKDYERALNIAKEKYDLVDYGKKILDETTKTICNI